MDRRQWLASLGAGGVGLSLTWWSPMVRAVQWLSPSASVIDTRGLNANAQRVFDLSVSSADPSPTGVVLWTHIRPEAVRLNEPLWLQVAFDVQFGQLVLQARIDPQEISPERDHTIKVDLDGLLPTQANALTCYFRFIYDGTVSHTGRCRTLPGNGTSLDHLKLGLLTCQDFTNGYYGALGHLAKDDSIDYVLHLGDFIYESAGDPRFQSLPFADRALALPSGSRFAMDLADYRAIYRTCRADAQLQAAMERHTFICIPDDHETANDCYWDYARDTLGAPDHPYTTDPRYGNDPALLRRLKLDSQRAWSEYVPARIAFNPLATHPHQALSAYRRFAFGRFLDLFVIENRSYRSPHPCGEKDFGGRYLPASCTTLSPPLQTLLGAAQHDWLIEGLTQSKATWKLMGNQTFFGRLALTTSQGVQIAPLDVDAWDGYVAERQAIASALREAKVRNFVVATGDLHSYIASHIKHDYGNLSPLDTSNQLGVEFMTPSVTSSSLSETLGPKLTPAQRLLLAQVLAGPFMKANNPHINFFDSANHGYSTLSFNNSFVEWVAYAVDKGNNSPLVGRRCISRQRKYMSSPWLSSQSTVGF